jgi:hypothetical protein
VGLDALSDWLGFLSGLAFAWPALHLLGLQRAAAPAGSSGDAEYDQASQAAKSGVAAWVGRFSERDARLTGLGFLLLLASFAASLAHRWLGGG